ncbi:hypothetical protein LRE75_03260 [Streptomyces sp. 372A]
MSAVRLDKNEPTPPSPDGRSTEPLRAILPLLLAVFSVFLVLLTSLGHRDSSTGRRTTPAPTVTQCGATPTTSAAPGSHRSGTVPPGRSALKNPAAPKAPASGAH